MDNWNEGEHFIFVLLCNKLGTLYCLEMFKNVTKANLLTVLQEIGEEADSGLRVVQLKGLLLKSKEFLNDKDFVIEFMATTVTEWQNGEEINRLRSQQQMGEKHLSHNNGEVQQYG